MQSFITSMEQQERFFITFKEKLYSFMLALQSKELYPWLYHVTGPQMREKIPVGPIMQKNR
jgi:hypothetical protein